VRMEIFPSHKRSKNAIFSYMSIPEKFTKPYNSADTEGRIYKKWEDSGFFNPDVCIEHGITTSAAPVFSMVLPPPNVTGTLHLGHAFEDTVQDVLTRFARMQGKRTLWVPGADSAAIATQSRVEKNIQKDGGKSRYDLGREELVRRVSEFAENSKDIILSQLRKMGSSLDVAIERNIVGKSGSWCPYGETRIGQGRENAQAFLEANLQLAEERTAKLRAVVPAEAARARNVTAAAPATPDGK